MDVENDLPDQTVPVLRVDEVCDAPPYPHVPGVAQHRGERGRGLHHQPRVHGDRRTEAEALMVVGSSAGGCWLVSLLFLGSWVMGLSIFCIFCVSNIAFYN